MSEKEYDDLLEEIFARHMSVQTSGFNSGSYKPGLERMEAFLDILGLDMAQGCRYRTIHIAGTNGKGSVSSMMASALNAVGLKVGLFTSPHLLDFRERIKLIENDRARMISREDVFNFFTAQRGNAGKLGLSFFELTTGLAFWWFAKEEVDIAVIETGLGGRLDSTNVIIPELSIITSIGLDHCAILGNTRQEIAAEKAGIFKPGVPALVGEYDEETAQVFERTASSVHCPLFYADEYDSIPDMDLQGEYQKKNTDTVLTALELLGIDADDEAIAHTATITGLRGRWERLDIDFQRWSGTNASPCVITDIGHNPPALRWNTAQLTSMMESGRYDHLVIIYGIMADKALDDIIPMLPGVGCLSDADVNYIFTTPSTPRSLPADEIFRHFIEQISGTDAHPGMQVIDNVADAMAEASKRCTDRTLLYIGGSAFLVADVLKILGQTQKTSK